MLYPVRCYVHHTKTHTPLKIFSRNSESKGNKGKTGFSLAIQSLSLPDSDSANRNKRKLPCFSVT